jgi:hypothetical protein
MIKFNSGWEDEADHFLSPQKTGLEKIRKCIIFIVQLLRDLVIGATSHIIRQDIPDDMEHGTGRLQVLLIGEAPVLRDLGSRSHIGVFLKILCNKEMHRHLSAVLNRVSPASTNTLSIDIG